MEMQFVFIGLWATAFLTTKKALNKHVTVFSESPTVSATKTSLPVNTLSVKKLRACRLKISEGNIPE